MAIFGIPAVTNQSALSAWLAVMLVATQVSSSEAVGAGEVVLHGMGVLQPVRMVGWGLANMIIFATSVLLLLSERSLPEAPHPCIWAFCRGVRAREQAPRGSGPGCGAAKSRAGRRYHVPPACGARQSCDEPVGIGACPVKRATVRRARKHNGR